MIWKESHFHFPGFRVSCFALTSGFLNERHLYILRSPHGSFRPEATQCKYVIRHASLKNDSL